VRPDLVDSLPTEGKSERELVRSGTDASEGVETAMEEAREWLTMAEAVRNRNRIG
jgi:hypothetical protein